MRSCSNTPRGNWVSDWLGRWVAGWLLRQVWSWNTACWWSGRARWWPLPSFQKSTAALLLWMDLDNFLRYYKVTSQIRSPVVGDITRLVPFGLRQCNPGRYFDVPTSTASVGDELGHPARKFAQIHSDSSATALAESPRANSSWLFLYTAVCMEQHRHISSTISAVRPILRPGDVYALLRFRHWLSDAHGCLPSVIGPIRSFPVAAARVWNSLPQHVLSAPSLTVFQSRLKTHLFSRSFPWFTQP